MPLDFVGMDAAPHLIDIWRDAFPDDSLEDIREFFDLALDPSSCAVWVEDGRPVSMVFLLPATLEITSGSPLRLCYVYAAGTLTAFRGRGFFGQLLTQVHERLKGEGVDACFLHPASPGLFRFYKRFGYRTQFYVKESRFTAEEFLALEDKSNQYAGFDIKSDYAAERNEFLSGHPAWVRWPDKLLDYAVRTAKRAGGAAVSSDGCNAILQPVENKLFVSELLCCPTAESAFRHSLASMFAFDTVIQRQPVGRLDDTDCKEFGMICPLSDNVSHSLDRIGGIAYMGPAFD